MPQLQISFTDQERKWLRERRITRITDNQEALIYPMGAERFLSSRLFGNSKWQDNYYDIRAEIENKNVLVIPGYGNSGFLFAEAGARSVAVYDKDPLTIAWMKAFKKYYHYRGKHHSKKRFPSIGELLQALTCWYPPYGVLPTGRFKQILLRLLNPKALRRSYIFALLLLVQQAIENNPSENFELDKDIRFYTGELAQLLLEEKNNSFDTAFVPYLLGVENGIETKPDIVHFIEGLFAVVPRGHVLITPTQNSKEFRIAGKRHFVTTGYASIQNIPELQKYILKTDPNWFDTQGLAVLRATP